MSTSTALAPALALAPYAAALGFLHVFLSFRVIRLRYRFRRALGAGGEPALERAVRVHGNLTEHAPIALLLILLVGLCGWSPWIVHALGGALLAARIVHAWGVSQENENFTYRKIGMVGTFAVVAVSAALSAAAAFAG